MTWNIRAAYNKFKVEGGSAIEKVVCTYIDKADIIALQEASRLLHPATKFKCMAMENLKVHESGSLVTMVKTKDEKPFSDYEDLKLKPGQLPFAVFVTIKATEVNKGEPVAVLNVQFSTRDETRDQELKATAEFIEGKLKKKFDMVIVLGDFYKYSKDQLKILLDAIDSNAKTVIKLDAKAPITTVQGRRFDNILINAGTVKQLNLPAFSNFADGVDPRLSNLLNNYVTLISIGKDPTRLKECIDEYVEKHTTDSPPCDELWISSRMLSDHLPVQLKLKLINDANEETELSVGTWNIEDVYLEQKLTATDTRKLMNTAMKAFNILVFQELSVDGKLNIHQVDTKDPEGKPEHGYFIADTSNVKQEVVNDDIMHFKIGKNGKSVSRIPINVEVNGKDKYRICFYSIHFPSGGMKQGDIIQELKKLQENAIAYKECQLSLALGDFNSELSKWPKNILTREGLKEPLSCNGVSLSTPLKFQYTKVDTKSRLDYIIALNSFDTNKFDIGICTVLLPGSTPMDYPIEDWREISDHYPVLAELND